VLEYAPSMVWPVRALKARFADTSSGRETHFGGFGWQRLASALPATTRQSRAKRAAGLDQLRIDLGGGKQIGAAAAVDQAAPATR